jgi:hypothetical protein
MKNIFLLLLLFTTISFSQQQYFDAPFGGGGGYTPGWYIPNLEQLNNQLSTFGVSDLSTSGFYTSGGAGFLYLGFVPFLRIGGMGYGGSTSQSAATIDGLNREVVYSLGGGGFTVEYTLPFIKTIGISVGAILGGGSMEIELYRNSGQFNWNDIWLEAVDQNSPNLNRRINKNFWFFSPTLNVDIPIYRFIGFRIGAGYQMSFGGSWNVDNDLPLNNVPDEFNANAFFIQSGIFLGFFSY